MKIITYIVGFVALLGCNPFNKNQQSAMINKSVAEIEKNQKPFNPNFNVDSTSIQAFITLEVVDGKIKDTPKSIDFMRSSLLPFNPNSGNETFSINLYDAENKAVQTLKIENPLLIRSCDPSDGKISYKQIKNGLIHLTVPFSETTTKISLSDKNEKSLSITTIDIQPYYKAFLSRKR